MTTSATTTATADVLSAEEADTLAAAVKVLDALGDYHSGASDRLKGTASIVHDALSHLLVVAEVWDKSANAGRVL